MDRSDRVGRTGGGHTGRSCEVPLSIGDRIADKMRVRGVVSPGYGRARAILGEAPGSTGAP
jgi:hypothetical protein